MKSLKTILTTLTVTVVAAGALLVAQTATPAHHRHGQRAARMAAALGLTPDQQSQAKAIFQDARTQAQPIRQNLKQERQAIQAAIQAGKNPADVQAMAQSEGTELAQLAGIRAASMAKFYAILTPDQQQKLAAMHQNMRGHKRGGQAQGASD